MSLTYITNGTLSDASQLNQSLYELQRLAGQTEVGVYFWEAGTGNSTGWTVGGWVSTRSRYTAIVSVTVDTTISLSALTSVGTQQASSSGVFVGGASSGSSSNTARCGGNITFQY